MPCDLRLSFAVRCSVMCADLCCALRCAALYCALRCALSLSLPLSLLQDSAASVFLSPDVQRVARDLLTALRFHPAVARPPSAR
jgi:hypothetical protein